MTRQPVVVPVIEYEPAPGSCPPRITACRPPNRPAPRAPRPAQLAPAPRDDRPALPAAAAFADVAPRGVLEVVDGRRPFAQLRPLIAVGLIDTVTALTRKPRPASARPARLRQVRLRTVDRDGQAAEVFATYTRGDRVRAVAGRVECAVIRGAKRWSLVALHMG